MATVKVTSRSGSRPSSSANSNKQSFSANKQSFSANKQSFSANKQSFSASRQSAAPARREGDSSSSRTGEMRKKVCFFCESVKEPTYTDSVTLRKFMNDRTRIMSHLRSGVCSKHQRRLTKEIKHARHLALLPFIPSI